MSTGLLDHVAAPVVPQLDGEERDRFSHYVERSKVTDAAVFGTPIIALCGKVWVPNRDPERYPVCPTCKEIYAGLPKGGD